MFAPKRSHLIYYRKEVELGTSSQIGLNIRGYYPPFITSHIFDCRCRYTLLDIWTGPHCFRLRPLVY